MQAQSDFSHTIHPSYREPDIAQAKLSIKLDYILKRIDSYWPEETDRSLVLYKRLFVGQRIKKIALNLNVNIKKLKWLLSDFRRLWLLYKNYRRPNNNFKKLTSQHLTFIQQFLNFNHNTSYWTAATLQKALLSEFPDIYQISQSTLRSRLKDTFYMSYKRIKKQTKAATEKQNVWQFALAWTMQAKLNLLDSELIFIDEFLLSEISFKFFGWSKKGKSGYFNSISDSFSMSFFVAFSADRFYGIMGTKGTGTAQKFIHFLGKVLKQRMKTISLEMRRFFIILDNASIHKTREVSKFVSDKKIRVLTIPPYNPYLNPVEKFILALKNKLRQKKQRSQ